jgi:hypothetical protein
LGCQTNRSGAPARQRPVTQEDFADFLACFQPGESREADEIRAALEEFDAIAEALPDNDEASGANLGDEEKA